MQLNLILSLTHSHSSPGFIVAHCIRMIRSRYLKHQNIFPLSCGVSERLLNSQALPEVLGGGELHGACDQKYQEGVGAITDVFQCFSWCNNSCRLMQVVEGVT